MTNQSKQARRPELSPRMLLRGVLLLAIAGTAPITALAETEPAADEALQQQLHDARRKLDEAAREFAELHQQLAPSDFAAPVQGFPGVHQSIAISATDVAMEGGFLGVAINGMTPDGIRLAGVSPNSGAAEAGMLAGDVLTAVNGVELAAASSPYELLHETIGTLTPGETVQLNVLRGDDPLSFDVEVKARSELSAIGGAFLERKVRVMESGGTVGTVDVEVVGPHTAANGELLTELPQWRQLGVVGGTGMGPSSMPHLVPVSPELGAYFGVDSGILVIEAATASNLRPGDIVAAINGVAVTDVGDVYRALMIGVAGTATLLRQGGEVHVELPPR